MGSIEKCSPISVRMKAHLMFKGVKRYAGELNKNRTRECICTELLSLIPDLECVCVKLVTVCLPKGFISQQRRYIIQLQVKMYFNHHHVYDRTLVNISTNSLWCNTFRHQVMILSHQPASGDVFWQIRKVVFHVWGRGLESCGKLASQWEQAVQGPTAR